jgi:hypothetical protein
MEGFEKVVGEVRSDSCTAAVANDVDNALCGLDESCRLEEALVEGERTGWGRGVALG